MIDNAFESIRVSAYYEHKEVRRVTTERCKLASQLRGYQLGMHSLGGTADDFTTFVSLSKHFPNFVRMGGLPRQAAAAAACDVAQCTPGKGARTSVEDALDWGSHELMERKVCTLPSSHGRNA